MITKSQNKISFTSIKPQKLLGESALKVFKAEMGYLKSASKIDYKMDLAENKRTLSKKLKCKLINNLCKLKVEINDRFIGDDITALNFKSYDELKEKLITNIKSKGNKADCFEDAILIYIYLLSKKVKPHNLEIVVHRKDAYFDIANHFTTVFGLKENADITKPATWGSKAVIVDAWANIVEPAKNALEKIQHTLLAGHELDHVKYSSFPKINVSDK